MKSFKSSGVLVLNMEVVTAYHAEQMLKSYVQTSDSILSQSVDDALEFATYPCVLKIVSQKALHKTEVKAVRIVHNKEGLEREYMNLLRLGIQKKLHMEGILVQKFEKGSEVFIGIKNDPVFGHVIGLGVGGTLVEELKDVQWRVCPISDKDANSMIENLTFKNLVKGFRGTHNNVKALKKTLLKLSTFPKKYANLEEMDINPLILNEDDATVVDARIILK